ncbi:7-carboxy-7-deazaguanine synthase [Candidatus Cyrtobacter comes]|uniref:7-carboxy-7-deazaguanine synthase n=1 Tax=Candidatus Cyrtobacter comes TaxID=675776 RepID=A0ABU5L9X2_9RICK|nr:7-carboxy-7-deazaguanine synthase QueE [Candidatus Cyrtobacter comes]MDZ5762725.1 7-carboxy-7-deazaguanine synthase [Candidatus Cyrtobacter comes]
MFGNNIKLKPESGDGSSLKVHSIFHTIQGEGPFAGRPATFIRLSGCNLACNFCDTEFDSYEVLDVDLIATRVLAHEGLVVITGGEPFRQTLGPLCKLLTSYKKDVQIETNGTLYNEIDNKVTIVCSPKNVSGMYSRIREDILVRATAIKFLISAYDKRYNDIHEVGQSDYNIPVYVQPMDEYDDEKNKANMLKAIEIAKSYNVILGTVNKGCI